MELPFEGLLGDTPELRLIQFLLPMNECEFNTSDLVNGAKVSRKELNRAIRKLMNWNIVRIVRKRGNVKYYSLNKNSCFITIFEDLNNCIIEKMLGDEAMANSQLPCPKGRGL